jgi:hypothetical protein
MARHAVEHERVVVAQLAVAEDTEPTTMGPDTLVKA